MKKYIDIFVRAMLAVSMGVVFGLTFVQVISRYVFKLSIPWAQDIVRMSFVYCVFFGAAYCIQAKKHINVDILIDMLPNKLKGIANLALTCIVLAFVCLLTYEGVQFAIAGKFQVASYIRMPMTVFYASVPLSMLCSAYYLVLQAIDQIKAIKTLNELGEEVEK